MCHYGSPSYFSCPILISHFCHIITTFLAEELGFNKFSFHDVFEVNDSEKEAVEKLSEYGIYNDIDELREKLEYAGKCLLYMLG